jgi:hypothetical protein
MHRHVFARVTQSILVVALLVGMPRSIEAAPISLETVLSGTAALGDIFELSVSFDLNGAAANLVGQELYIDLLGLSAIGGSYQLGSVYTDFTADLLTIDGDCADVGCTDPTSTLGSRYLSMVNAFSPAAPAGPGVLFTMQLNATGAPWSLNLVGDSDFSMFSDPLLDGFISPIPFAIVTGNTAVPTGTASVHVNLRQVTPHARVPEPSTMLLTLAGLVTAGVARRRRAPSRNEQPGS